MQLCKTNLAKISATSVSDIPANTIFNLPEKVLQFGTGVLLRGLCDFIIANANNKNIFNGRIMVVKSTTAGDTKAFSTQDCLYTLCVRGRLNGKEVKENHLVPSISRVLDANSQWNEILICATNPAMELVISNTTEVGLTLAQDDIFQNPPRSFPGKLLAFLYHRYQFFKGDINKGLVIIPTELLPGNGEILLNIILQLCRQNNLDPAFENWIITANYFCSSLVDRIVPGKLPTGGQQEVEKSLQYTDGLMIMGEPYHLWAIETNNEKVKKILSFATAHSNVVLAPNINKFRELKLRLLNSPHTFSCGLAYLAGFITVREAMQNDAFRQYLVHLMYREIIPVITSSEISKAEAETFAGTVLDRFSNNFIEHRWLSITMQYSSKMTARNISLICKYVSDFNLVPDYMALGMAAHILFMKGQPQADGSYAGTIAGKSYLINDDNAAFFATAWEQKNNSAIVDKILSNENIWQSNVALMQHFKQAVINWLAVLLADGALTAMKMINKKDQV